MRRGLTSTVLVTVLTAVAALLLLIWGAGNGSRLVGAPQGTWGPPPITLSVPTTAVPQPDQTASPWEDLPPEEGAERLVDILLLGVLIAVVVALLFILKALLTRERESREALRLPDEDELVALLEASSDEVRYRALAEGDPRNAVVACWVALEEAVHRSGLRQNRAETASELTRRVLSRWEVDPEAISALSAAYREARFSRHPVTEEQRRAAVDALERIHEDLRRRVRAEQDAAQATEAQAEEAAGAQGPGDQSVGAQATAAQDVSPAGQPAPRPGRGRR